MKTVRTFKNDGSFTNKLIFMQVNNVMVKAIKKANLTESEKKLKKITISILNSVISATFSNGETKKLNFSNFSDQEKQNLKKQLLMLGGNYLKLQFEENTNLINYIEICQENQKLN